MTIITQFRAAAFWIFCLLFCILIFIMSSRYAIGPGISWFFPHMAIPMTIVLVIYRPRMALISWCMYSSVSWFTYSTGPYRFGSGLDTVMAGFILIFAFKYSLLRDSICNYEISKAVFLSALLLPFIDINYYNDGFSVRFYSFYTMISLCTVYGYILGDVNKAIKSRLFIIYISICVLLFASKYIFNFESRIIIFEEFDINGRIRETLVVWMGSPKPIQTVLSMFLCCIVGALIKECITRQNSCLPIIRRSDIPTLSIIIVEFALFQLFFSIPGENGGTGVHIGFYYTALMPLSFYISLSFGGRGFAMVIVTSLLSYVQTGVALGKILGETAGDTRDSRYYFMNLVLDNGLVFQTGIDIFRYGIAIHAIPIVIFSYAGYYIYSRRI